MTNAVLLNEKIKQSGLKKSFICDAIGLSRQGFDIKCKNKVDFKAGEIEKLCTILGISVKERMAIFFAK